MSGSSGRERIVVAMSGGVDSSVAAVLLLEQGFEVVGVTLRLSAESSGRWGDLDGCCSAAALRRARAVADHLGFSHHVLDAAREFEDAVVSPFVDAYLQGETPNPCIACNRRVKFEWLRHQAARWGATKVATGHYARVESDAATGRYRLRRGADPRKDQSYFLYALRQEQLAAVHFPVGHLHKADTRELARMLGLPTAQQPESQEICFAHGDYRKYLDAVVRDRMRPGAIRDASGAVRGEHRGVANFTVGQRHGLGISGPQPLYVLAVDADRDEVIVGSERDLWREEARVGAVSLISGEPLQEPRRVLVKVRSTQSALPALVRPTSEDELLLRFDAPQRALAPGQAAVFYDPEDPDLVLGGGTIQRPTRSA